MNRNICRTGAYLPKEERLPTLQDVAVRVGVSKQAISLALNKKKGVSDPLREKIMQVCREMQYQPPTGLQERKRRRAELVPSLSTIANLAGVSKTAASVALKGGGHLSKELVGRVCAIAESIGYKSSPCLTDCMTKLVQRRYALAQSKVPSLPASSCFD